MVAVAVLRPCSTPGCPALVAAGRCPAHRRDAENRRGSATKRGYNSAWDRLRRLQLALEPCCRECAKQGFVVGATEVDHIIPIVKRPDLRLVQSNLQSMCKSHHSKKTAAENKFDSRRPSVRSREWKEIIR
jgi:5-methylcytosine-specific restriction protein A